MEIKNIKFENHPILKNLELNFENKKTIVIAGNNGSGKTTILNYIVKNIEKKIGIEIGNDYDANSDKLIYLPAEIEFPNLTSRVEKYEEKKNFLTIVDNSIISKIPQYITTRIFSEAMENSSKPLAEIILKITEEINELFSDLKLDVKMIGLSKNGENLPLFRNSFGSEFDINSLSSGEKQLFLRIFALKMLKIDNSIILIDEPEISLHPRWQQLIVKVYEKIGKNNQLIITTHSPQIISSVKAENIIILNKNNKTQNIEAIRGDTLGRTYGKNIEIILQQIMGINDSRIPDVQDMITALQNLIDKNEYETTEFKNKMDELENIIGSTDEELLLMKIDIARRGRKIAKGK